MSMLTSSAWISIPQPTRFTRTKTPVYKLCSQWSTPLFPSTPMAACPDPHRQVQVAPHPRRQPHHPAKKVPPSAVASMTLNLSKLRPPALVSVSASVLRLTAQPCSLSLVGTKCAANHTAALHPSSAPPSCPEAAHTTTWVAPALH